MNSTILDGNNIMQVTIGIIVIIISNIIIWACKHTWGIIAKQTKEAHANNPHAKSLTFIDLLTPVIALSIMTGVLGIMDVRFSLFFLFILFVLNNLRFCLLPPNNHPFNTVSMVITNLCCLLFLIIIKQTA